MTRRKENNYQKNNLKKKKPFAKKSFGQNFLVDQEYINKIIDALDPQQQETIIEIGAGRGALTEKLLELSGKVLAIELDRDLIPVLRAEFEGENNFVLIESDALKIDFREMLIKSETSDQYKAKLVANLPYYISTAILQKLLIQRDCFTELVLMLQREVVDRITAQPGNSERGFLSVLVEAFAVPEKLFDVPPAAFRPIPKVWSSVVRLKIKEPSLITEGGVDEKIFLQIVSQGFSQKRKTILNNLKNAPQNLAEKFLEQGTVDKVLELAGIESTRRAETLTIEEWHKIAQIIGH